MSNEIYSEELLFNFLENYHKTLEQQSKLNGTLTIENYEALIQEHLVFLPKLKNKSYALNTIGISYYNLNKLAEAIEYTKQAVAFDPHIIQYRCNLALFLFHSGEIKQALDTLKGIDLLWLENNDPEKEKADFFNAANAFEDEVIQIELESKPNDVDAILQLAEYCADSEKYEKAVECYIMILEIKPKCFDTLSSISYLSFQAGNVKRAILYGLKALQIKPDNYNILLLIVRLYYYNKEYSKALTMLNKATDYYPEEPKFLFYLALAHTQLFQYNEALIYIEKYLEINPDLDVQIKREMILQHIRNEQLA
ncbi:MAG: tetratricopeptide repeat protein [Candidatus Heimdallarchaeota archaeon]